MSPKGTSHSQEVGLELSATRSSFLKKHWLTFIWRMKEAWSSAPAIAVLSELCNSPPKTRTNYGYQWFGAFEYELLSLFAQYVVQEQQVLAAFSIFTQREYLQSKNVGMFPQLCMRQHSSSSAGSPLSAHQPLSLQKLYYTPEKELLLFFFPGSINFSRTKNRHRGERSWSVLAM